MDEALALPSELAATLALRTQQVILEETGVANTIDPLGGSYFLEKLTNDTEAAVYRYFRQIEDLGGVLPAIEHGFFQSEIADASYQLQLEMDRKERVTVGVNRYANDDPIQIPILAMDPKGYEKQVARLNQVRTQRDPSQAAAALSQLREAASGDTNVMPALIACAHAYCTLGEMTDVMREAFGLYTEPLFI
jgi:methylmalonyl-CoA mutase N-terminal domain/subunit